MSPGVAQGQYSFVIYDSHRRGVFAARDPSGREPLYYAVDEDEGLRCCCHLPLHAADVHAWHRICESHAVLCCSCNEPCVLFDVWCDDGIHAAYAFATPACSFTNKPFDVPGGERKTDWDQVSCSGTCNTAACTWQFMPAPSDCTILPNNVSSDVTLIGALMMQVPPGHFIAGKNDTKLQQFALTPAQLHEREVRASSFAP